MNIKFERGKDPKETMGIGKRVDAIEIVGVAGISLVREGLEIYDEGYPAVMPHSRILKDYNEIPDESHILRVLLGVQNGHLNPATHAVIRFDPQTGGLNGLPHFHPARYYTDMEEVLGEYVKFKNNLYRIPTYNEFRKAQESQREHESRGPFIPPRCL